MVAIITRKVPRKTQRLHRARQERPLCRRQPWPDTYTALRGKLPAKGPPISSDLQRSNTCCPLPPSALTHVNGAVQYSVIHCLGGREAKQPGKGAGSWIGKGTASRRRAPALPLSMQSEQMHRKVSTAVISTSRQPRPPRAKQRRGRPGHL